MKLKPYPKCKDSGIQWIGEIPEGWEVGKLKFTLSKKRDSIKTGPFGSQLTIDEMYDHEYKVYNQKNVITKDETLGENYVSDEKFKELSAFKVSPGELLITTRGTIGKTLRLSKNAETGILHPCLMKINTNYEIIDNRFIEILLEESNIVSIQLFLQSNATTIDVIYQDNLKEVLLSLPPCPEQTTIASFLDKKTAKIDALIEKDKKLIALLKEKRTTLINHAVTKGLDPNIKLKDSRIKWIGEIPEGWDLIKIKHIAGNCSIPVQTGPFGAQLHADDYVNEGIPFILIRNVNHGKINNTNIPFVSEEDAERLFMYRLKADDIVFSRVGSLGRAALVTNREEGWLISGQMLRLRLKDKRINRNYLVYLFQSKLSEEYVSYESVGSTRESLNTEILSNFISPLPPLPDQTAIANFLDQATSKIDKTINLIQKKIKLLEEYKKSLIHYVVTGKVDVRGVEA